MAEIEHTAENDATVMNASLQVNECQIWATQRGVAWWDAFRRRFDGTRISTLAASVAGDRVAIACADREGAEYLRALAISNGVPASALKITRVIPPVEPRCNPVGGVHALWCPDRPTPPAGGTDE